MTALAALETSTRRGTVALLLDDELHVAELGADRAHASDLLPALDQLLAASDRSIGSLDALVVGLGPGSYTGLRVAAATALGLTRGSGVPLVGVPSFEAAAFAALEDGEEGVVLQDARSGAIYHARYARANGGLQVLTPPSVSAPEKLVASLQPDAILIGDEAALRAARLDARTSPSARALRAFAPEAGVLARLGARQLHAHGPTPREAIEPLYLRPFAARRAGA